jgi:hypothetical protein
MPAKPVGDSYKFKTYLQIRDDNIAEYKRQKGEGKWALLAEFAPLENKSQFLRIHKFAMANVAVQKPPIDFTTVGDVGNLQDSPHNPARVAVVEAVKNSEFVGVDPLDQDIYEATCMVVALLMSSIQREIGLSGVTPGQANSYIADLQSLASKQVV